MKEHSVNWSKVWVSTMRHGRCPNACASSSKLRIARQHFTAEANRIFGKMHLLASWRILKKLQLFWNWIGENGITYIYKMLTTSRSCNKSWMSEQSQQYPLTKCECVTTVTTRCFCWNFAHRFLGEKSWKTSLLVKMVKSF